MKFQFNQKKFFLCLAPSMFVALIFTGCQPQAVDNETTSESTATEPNTERKEGSVVIGLDDTIPPLEFRNISGQLIGYDVELAKETFKRLDMEVIFKPIDWTKRDEELESKKIDMIWSGMNITPERRNQYLFSDPYLDNTSLIVVAADSDIMSKYGLNNRTIGYPSGYTVGQEIEKFANENGLNINSVGVSEGGVGLSMLLTGELDAMTSDGPQMKFYINNSPDKFRILEEDFGTLPVGIAFRKDDTELQSKVNNTLAEIKRDGTEEEIYAKWIGTK